MPKSGKVNTDRQDEGRSDHFMDIDRMINEGLGGGLVTMDNGLIEETTTDSMRHPESSETQHNKTNAQGDEQK